MYSYLSMTLFFFLSRNIPITYLFFNIMLDLLTFQDGNLLILTIFTFLVLVQTPVIGWGRQEIA